MNPYHDLVAKLLHEVPHFFVYSLCSAREALVITDASNYFPEFNYIDKLVNKVYSWLGKSRERHG